MLVESVSVLACPLYSNGHPDTWEQVQKKAPDSPCLCVVSVDTSGHVRTHGQEYLLLVK